SSMLCCILFQAEDGIRDRNVTGVQTCALPIFGRRPPGECRDDLDRRHAVAMVRHRPRRRRGTHRRGGDQRMRDYYPKARNTDPSTSWEAVDRMRPASTRMYARMIETLSASAASLAQPEIAERYKQRWDDPR